MASSAVMLIGGVGLSLWLIRAVEYFELDAQRIEYCRFCIVLMAVDIFFLIELFHPIGEILLLVFKVAINRPAILQLISARACENLSHLFHRKKTIRNQVQLRFF